MTNPDLAALSAAATQGEWRIRVGPRDDENTCDLAICGDIFVLADFHGPQYPHQHPNAALIVNLVNEYRAGRLVQIDEGMREATARAEAAEAETVRLRKALVDVTHFADRNGVDIARQALGAEHGK